MGGGSIETPVRSEAWQRRLLEALRADAQEGLPDAVGLQKTSGLVEVLSLELAEERYGVRIAHVAEILLPRPLTPVPRTPAFLLGVVSLRGAVLPVLDLARYLGLEGAVRPEGSRILILRDGDERVGFWVDAVRGVVRFSEEDVEATSFVASVDRRFLRGIGYDREGNLVALLNEECLCAFDVEGR